MNLEGSPTPVFFVDNQVFFTSIPVTEGDPRVSFVSQTNPPIEDANISRVTIEETRKTVRRKTHGTTVYVTMSVLERFFSFFFCTKTKLTRNLKLYDVTL